LLPRRVWAHRSSLLDVRLLFARSLFGLILVTPRTLGALAIALAVGSGLDSILGSVPRSTSMGVSVSIAFTIATFVVDDFSSFLVHRAMHRVPFLWELHKVHHSAEVMTPLTVYRVHPIEGWLNQLRGALSMGLVAGIFLHFAPGPIRAATIAGVDVLGITFSIFGANLRHSHVRLSWGRVLERFFISPAMHQIHHGRKREQHDRNFGSALAIWDWIFGSLRVASPKDRIRFGLPREDRNHHPARLGSVVVGPIVALFRRTPS
jgi:sterol desaturase/sphingolipid hydroxylase (fatty acid hydroxylase superfamily)